MAKVKLIINFEGQAKMLRGLKKFGASDDLAKCILTCLKETQEQYLGATDHLSKAYTLHQPTAVKHFNDGKISTFWVFAADALFDMGIIHLCSNLDEDKSIRHKNLRKLIRNIDLLKKKPANMPTLDPSTEELYKKVKVYRDTKVAHPEHKVSSPFSWHDPIKISNIIHRFLADFYYIFFNIDFEPFTLQMLAELDSSKNCKSIGFTAAQHKDIKKEITSYFSKIK